MSRILFCMTAMAFAAAPAFAQSKPTAAEDSLHQAQVSGMKAELQKLVVAENSHRSEYGAYAQTLEPKEFKPGADFKVTIIRADTTGWAATMTGAEPGLTCGVFDGDGRPPNAVLTEKGKPVCWRPGAGGKLSAE